MFSGISSYHPDQASAGLRMAQPLHEAEMAEGLAEGLEAPPHSGLGLREFRV